MRGNFGEIDCPHGSIWITSAPGLTFASRVVSVYGGVCDSCDRCGLESCRFFDQSEDGDRRFAEGLAHSQTLEGLIEEQGPRGRF